MLCILGASFLQIAFVFQEGKPSNLNTHWECGNQQHRSDNGISQQNPDQKHKPQLGKALPVPISEPTIQYTKVQEHNPGLGYIVNSAWLKLLNANVLSRLTFYYYYFILNVAAVHQ